MSARESASDVFHRHGFGTIRLISQYAKLTEKNVERAVGNLRRDNRVRRYATIGGKQAVYGLTKEGARLAGVDERRFSKELSLDVKREAITFLAFSERTAAVLATACVSLACWLALSWLRK
jgi:hypothetical protein